ncbi:hypothetical protein [Peredibacter starrii]|uniref:Uncharacterized protein n=1 Tax=Peredibacter starrii TaxID=28202 RepID=A0AAX4HPB4_9BACT|nr:hypothetical protein [Peredibacter starrii]WPU65089.1 hypothetical protein SOO65_20540 [Peredibacter starrii]
MIKSIILASIMSTSALAATIVPFERDVARIDRYNYITARNDASTVFRTEYGADDNAVLFKRGFSFTNFGPNDIVPTEPNDSFEYPTRDFFFVTDDGAKRDTYLWMTDYVGSGRTSDYFETMLVFLPRVGQMHVEEQDQNLIVTLNTGEEMVVFKKYKTLIGGVMTEQPVDLNPDRAQRKFAQIDYTGKGIMLRSDAKGADPRLAKTVTVFKKGLPGCKIPGPTFWTQDGHPKFKFVNDEDAYTVIKDKCGAQYMPEI